MRRIALLVACSLAGLVLLPSVASAHHVREGDVRFKVTCKYSHSLQDDPIVYPGQPGAAHLHDFYGNTGVNAGTTTFEQLRALGTNCNAVAADGTKTADKAGYWTPAIYANGQRVLPGAMTVYYRLGGKHAPISPWGAGLKVIAGYNMATGLGQEHVGWKCGEDLGPQLGQDPPASCASSDLTANVEFPDCWDGANLDSADHRSHMSYSADPYPGAPAATCDAAHPVPVPKIFEIIHYFTTARPITVSMKMPDGTVMPGPSYTYHADFSDGWDPGELQKRIDACLNAYVKCESGTTTPMSTALRRR